MLHAGVERDHREIVGVRDGVDVTRQTQRKLRERNHLRETAARRRSLDVEGRSARGLPHAADDLPSQLAESLHETKRGGRFALTKRRRGDCRHIDILRALPFAQTRQNLRDVDLREIPSVRFPFRLQKPQLRRQVLRGAQILLRRFGDLPVLHLHRIEFCHFVLPFINPSHGEGF